MSEPRFRDSSVLVTGAYGFVGSHLTERLVDDGAHVVVARRDEPADSYFDEAGLDRFCDVVQCDLLDQESLVRILVEHEVEAVFHLAAQTIVGTANLSPLSTFESNIRGTYTLLEACRVAGVIEGAGRRVVVASSDKAYGRHEELPYREDSPLVPSYPYDVSKAAADMIARSYAETFSMPVAVTRLANVYGPGDMNMSRIVPDTARALARGERPRLRSDGSPQRDFIHVRDAVEAYLAVGESLDRPELHGRAWNAGAGEPVSVLDLVNRLIAVSGRDVEPEIAGEGVPAGEIDRQWLDSTAIAEELGWHARIGLDEGLADAWAWYSERLSR